MGELVLRTANVEPMTAFYRDVIGLEPFAKFRNANFLKVADDFEGHQTVNHSAGEYVRGDVYTNTVESVFSLLKRSLIGTFHSVSRHHLPRYLDELSYRWDTRHMTDGLRTAKALRRAEGKRLRYREPVRSRGGY